MKKRKTAVLLAAVLCLELWIGAAPESGRQKSLIPASAAELSDQTALEETAEALIIVESEVPPEPESSMSGRVCTQMRLRIFMVIKVIEWYRRKQKYE